MRFISQYPGYKFQVRPQRMRGLGDGSAEILQEPIYAEFLAVNGGAMIYENEVAAALKHFDFRGNTQEQDEATPSDPIQRLSVYDTQEMAKVHGWSADEIKLVEDRLTQLCLDAPNECLLVTDTPITAPFPAYDSFDGDPDQLVAKLVEDGFDLALVLHYERVFGLGREPIIEALESQIELDQEDVVVA